MNFKSITLQLLKNRKLAKAIQEVSWAQFRAMLEFRGKWYGKKVYSCIQNPPYKPGFKKPKY
jgi:transposase